MDLNILGDKKFRRFYLHGEVNEESVGKLIEQIHLINEFDTEMECIQVGYEREPIVITVNSGGGSVYDGFALISAIDLSITPIVTQVLGHAMSMGLAIALSGHYRYAHRYSSFLYHEIANGHIGKLTSHEENIYELKRLQRMYDDLLLEKSNITKGKLNKIKSRRRDYVFSANEALDFGFVDGLLKVEEVVEEEE